jgi:ketosteroid isomerase-like protein
MNHWEWNRTVRVFLFDAPFRRDLLSDTPMRRQQSHGPARSLSAYTLVVIFLIAFAHAAAALPHHENHVVHKEIEALEQQWRQANIANNVNVMNSLLADDYIGITSNGTVETKAQVLAQRRAGTMRITTLDISDLHVRVYGDTAVVTSRAELAGTNGASDIGGEYRYTRVYNRRFGQWKIVSFEASRMHDPTGKPEKH